MENEQQQCDLCDSAMREGKYGEASWICTNEACEKYHPQWPIYRLQSKLEPIYAEIEAVSEFSSGKIHMEMEQWQGDGSFQVIFTDGLEVQCSVDGGVITPEHPELTEEIRSKLYKLIELREKLEQSMMEGV